MSIPHCPSCKKPLTVFWDSYKMWNLFALKCPYCYAKLRTPMRLAVATILSLFYGYAVGSLSLFFSYRFQSETWLYAVNVVGVVLVILFFAWFWQRLRFQLKTV